MCVCVLRDELSLKSVPQARLDASKCNARTAAPSSGSNDAYSKSVRRQALSCAPGQARGNSCVRLLGLE